MNALQLDASDMLVIERVIDTALKQIVKDCSDQGLVEQEEPLRQACERTFEMLRSLGGASSASEPLETTSLAGTSANVDSELLELHQQVCEAAKRVQALRQTVPQEISASLARQMESMRPAINAIKDNPQMTTSAPAAEGVTDVAEGSCDAGEPCSSGLGTAEVEGLRGTLAEAMDRLPALRARLDQGVQRLSRILTAIESEQSRPSPRTVERVLLNPMALAEADVTAELTTVPAGADLTRKRLAKDLMAAVALAAGL